MQFSDVYARCVLPDHSKRQMRRCSSLHISRKKHTLSQCDTNPHVFAVSAVSAREQQQFDDLWRCAVKWNNKSNSCIMWDRSTRREIDAARRDAGRRWSVRFCVHYKIMLLCGESLVHFAELRHYTKSVYHMWRTISGNMKIHTFMAWHGRKDQFNHTTDVVARAEMREWPIA